MIRKATVQDLEKIQSIVSKFDQRFFFDLKDLIENKFNIIYLYEKSKEVLAFLIIEICYETVNITALYVEEKSRRKKIASSLLDYLLSDLNHNISNLMLEVNKNNQKAINLYKNFGFEIINVRKNYYNESDAYVMRKELIYE